MEVFTEKEAEDFLENEKFDVIERVYVEKENELKNATEKLGFPLVMKVSGQEIVHKNKVGGVVKGIKDYEIAWEVFNKLQEIKGVQGVMIQKQIKGKEFLLGIKRTPEFGHVICFGAGGIHTEKLKDVSFRVYPFGKREIKKMMEEVNASKDLDKKSIKIIEKNIFKLCRLTKKYPRIKELDINPLIQGRVVDARIVWQ
ncbi:acetate--CoA ligase family protein [Candidatus Pacearchaeota archaeon]|nr:acetate--CoA ligase family protein [Candidatus Pacearchaeota archaeon]